MAAAAMLSSSGELRAALDNGPTEPATLQLRSLTKLANGKWACTVTDADGVTADARLAGSIAKDLTAGKVVLHGGDIVRVDNYSVISSDKGKVMMVVSLALVQAAANGTPATDASGSRPDQAQQPQPHTPAAAPKPGGAQLTPGPTPSPSEEMKAGLGLTPGAMASVPKGPSFTPGPPAASPGQLAVAEKRSGVHPIAALNPYDTKWCIKAKLVRKAPPRSFPGRGGGTSHVFNVELADAEGSQLQATFWREAASKYMDLLQEGKVYYFTNFTVKPANKQFATVRNDYEAHMDARTEVEEAADQGGISAAQQLDLVPFDRLTRHVGRKMPVDILGVVTAAGPLGTIKRKADQSELARRDITLADSSCKSVVLTLWADQASHADLDGCEGQVLQVTCVRVGDYNGCSLSAVTRSQVTLNPDSPEASVLRDWWAAEGASASLEPLGQAGGMGGGGPAGRSAKLQFLSDVVVTSDLPSPDAKPTYHDVVVAVMQVRDDQTLYYLANPENGKKVEPRDGRFWCEADARFVDGAAHRFVFNARVADGSREAFVNLFDAQGNQMLGASANDLAALKDAGDEAAVSKVLKAAQWGEWAMTLAARSREYNGETRMRYTVVRMSPLDYAAEGHRLLQLINQAAA